MQELVDWGIKIIDQKLRLVTIVKVKMVKELTQETLWEAFWINITVLILCKQQQLQINLKNKL